MDTLRRKLIAGNWKMYKTTTEAAAFVDVLAEHGGIPGQDKGTDVEVGGRYSDGDQLASNLPRRTARSRSSPFYGRSWVSFV